MLLIEWHLATAGGLGPALGVRSAPASAPKCHSSDRSDDNRLRVDTNL